MERVEVFVGERIPRNGVDGEIAPPRRLLDSHRGVAGDRKAAMTSPRLRIASRQRDIDTLDFVDLKTRPDRFDTAERFEDRPQFAGWNPEHFDVDIGRRLVEQAITDPAANDQR